MAAGRGHAVDVAAIAAGITLGIDAFADGKTSAPTGGSHNTTTTKEIAAAPAAGIKTKVYALTLSTLDVTLDNIVRITDGSAGTVLYEVELGTGVQGVTLPGSLIAYFSTTAATALHIKLSAAQKVTYSFSQYPEA